MAVKIRLARHGAKKQAFYRIVIADVRSPRDGRFIEKIGTYNPGTDPQEIDIRGERLEYWLVQGAKPTETVGSLINRWRLTEEQSAADE